MKSLFVGIIMIVMILALIGLYAWELITQPAEPSQCDLNRDGLVNSSDVNLAYKISRGLIATNEMVGRADVNRDGLVDDKDVCLIFDAVLGGD